MRFGSICWYCYWGWPEQTMTVYRDALQKLDDFEDPLLHGPAHAVWSDENFDDSDIKSAIKYAAEPNSDPHYTPEQIQIVVESLEALLLVPEEIRCCEPKDYDGEHPAMFPPPAHLTMITGRR